MIDNDGVYTCDYCNGTEGDFIEATGNHEACTEIERLRAELADAKDRAKKAEENWHANEARLGKLERVRKCAEKLVSLRGVTHGAWVIEELEAALGAA